LGANKRYASKLSTFTSENYTLLSIYNKMSGWCLELEVKSEMKKNNDPPA